MIQNRDKRDFTLYPRQKRGSFILCINTPEINYQQKGGDLTVERIISKNKITCINNRNIQQMTIFYETVANGNYPS